MDKSDMYAILELPIDATEEEIKSAMRRLVKKYHPDVNKTSEAVDKFIKVREAYDCLINNDNISDDKKNNIRDIYEDLLKRINAIMSNIEKNVAIIDDINEALDNLSNILTDINNKLTNMSNTIANIHNTLDDLLNTINESHNKMIRYLDKTEEKIDQILIQTTPPKGIVNKFCYYFGLKRKDGTNNMKEKVLKKDKKGK
jgi:DnaJ-class molecular chaperone